MKKSMSRVSKKNKCPVCGHDTWCLVGEKAVLCMRVQSDRPIRLSSGETGWWHPLDAGYQPPKSKLFEGKPAERSPLQWSQMMAVFDQQTYDVQRVRHAKELGVEPWTMGTRGVSACWDRKHQAWAYPMSDGFGKIVGIRLRNSDGKKWAIYGSHSGIFLPGINPDPTVLIVEGPTDTMAALSIGYFALGRPSCAGGSFYIKQAIERLACRRAAIIADNDEDDYEHPERSNPGLAGAKALAELMVVPTLVIVLPTKDLRELVKRGHARAIIDASIKNSVWRVP